MTIIRFTGAIVLAFVFSYLVEVFHVLFFGGVAHFFANLSWQNWLNFDILRGLLLPIIWAMLGVIGWGIVWLVKESKFIATIVILIFLLSAIADFRILLLNPIVLIVDDIGQGFWYYFGATITFIGMLVCYIACAVALVLYDPKSE